MEEVRTTIQNMQESIDNRFSDARGICLQPARRPELEKNATVKKRILVKDVREGFGTTMMFGGRGFATDLWHNTRPTY